MFATSVTMGLAEWIIDDTCLVILYFFLFFFRMLGTLIAKKNNCSCLNMKQH